MLYKILYYTSQERLMRYINENGIVTAKAEATAVLKESDNRSAAHDHIALLFYDGV